MLRRAQKFSNALRACSLPAIANLVSGPSGVILRVWRLLESALTGLSRLYIKLPFPSTATGSCSSDIIPDWPVHPSSYPSAVTRSSKHRTACSTVERAHGTHGPPGHREGNPAAEQTSASQKHPKTAHQDQTSLKFKISHLRRAKSGFSITNKGV